MTNIFYRLYVLSSGRKVISFLLFLIFLCTSLFFASKIRLEENIINVIPKDENISKISQAFGGFKMNSRLILHVYFKDSTAKDPQLLINTSHQLRDSLQTNFAGYISDVKLEFSDSNIETLYKYYLEYLPVYLEEEDYTKIAERTTKAGIEETVKKNYKALMSPMSIVTKKMLVKDPFSMASFPLQRTNSLRLDDNIELYQNHLLSKDQNHLIFFVTLTNPPNETSNNGLFLNGLNKLIKEVEQTSPAIKVEYFGQTAVSVANASRIKQDIYFTVSFAVVALFLFISFFYRSISVFFVAVTPGLFGAVVAIAILALVKGKVSAISLGVGSVLLGITIDFALHFITHFKHQKNLQALFNDISSPLLMSSFTTACAFFSLLFISSTALADLGIFAGTSVLAASLYTLVVLPHFVAGKTKKEEAKKVKRKNKVEKGVHWFAYYPFHKAKWAIGVFLILSTISLFTWRNFSFESDMLRLNYMPEELAQYEKNINAISTYSASNIYLISTGKNLWEALEAETAVKQKLQSLQNEGLIYDYVAVNDFIPPHSLQEKRIEKWKAFWQEKNADSVLNNFYISAQGVGFQTSAFGDFEKRLKSDYSLLNEQAVASIFSVFGEDLIIRNGDSTVSVVSSVKLKLENKKQVLKELEKLQGTLIFDKGYLTEKLLELLKEDFNKLVNLSLVVVFFVILLSYGRIELALISFVPILLSWLWILGLMGLFGLTFNIVNIIICTFIFGLGIDYSIFVMRGLGQDFKFGLNNLLSYKKSIILSAVTTLTGIGVLIFAEHPALKSIALLALIGIISVIFLTFTVQPILYRAFILKRKKKGVIPFTIASLLLSVFAFLYFLLGCMLLLLLRLAFVFPLAKEKKKKKIYHWIMMCFCRSLIYIMANVKKEIVGKENADFSKPSVIISNHHSFLDIMLLLMFSPKVVMVTNDWVYHSPFFGKAVQYADFILASKGVENQLDKIQELVNEGYSIIVFPEGTRSEGFDIGRFHKGAFLLASTLNLDIQPVVLHGTNHTMPKNDGFHLKSGRVTVKFLPRIKYNDEAFGETYSERTKKISKYFKAEYQKVREEKEIPDFFKEVILKNYIYKGPVLEWYLRVKYSLEQGYLLFHELVPANAHVVDVGCGYGFMSYALALSGEKRKVFGMDYDHEKIEVAKSCPAKPANLSFAHGDVTNYAFNEADVFIVSDVLHYLTPEDQMKLLNNLANKLSIGGKLIIRDGDSNKKDRHQGTKLTEIFSTKTGFNKTKNELYYISEDMISAFAKEHKYDLTIIDNTKLTSNTVFVLNHKG